MISMLLSKALQTVGNPFTEKFEKKREDRAVAVLLYYWSSRSS